MASGELLQFSQEIFSLRPGIANQVFHFNNPKIMGGADEIGEVSTPGRTDAAGQPETIILPFVQPRPRHDTADLSLFAKGKQIGQHAEVLAAPIAAGESHSGLDLVKNQQDVILITNPA